MENFFEEIIEKVKRKSHTRRIIILVISLFILALVYNLFLLPSGLVAGGVNGIALITNYVYEIGNEIYCYTYGYENLTVDEDKTQNIYNDGFKKLFKSGEKPQFCLFVFKIIEEE